MCQGRVGRGAAAAERPLRGWDECEPGGEGGAIHDETLGLVQAGHRAEIRRSVGIFQQEAAAAQQHP